MQNAITACAFEVKANGSSIQLLPAGPFKARDGRPHDVAAGHWYIDAQVATRLIAKVSARATELVIDYEHQTLNSAENGQPAPAAGWFKGSDLEWREGFGLLANRIRWTERAKAMITAGEYRYLSPVFTYNKQTGEMLDLHHVGLTNYPALDGMNSLQALAAARYGDEWGGTKAERDLSPEELEACRMMGLSTSDFRAALKEQNEPADKRLSPEELEVCRLLGLSASEYIAGKNA